MLTAWLLEMPDRRGIREAFSSLGFRRELLRAAVMLSRLLPECDHRFLPPETHPRQRLLSPK